MLENLRAFLLDLVDPEKKRAFLADPDEAMRMAGLTAREKSAVRRLLPRPAAPLRRGRLAVVGSGISIAQLTWESRIAIERADRVLYAVMDLASEAWIRAANP